MKLQIVPASRGALWVRQGFRIFFSRPLSFMALFGVLLLGMLVAQLLPWIGALLFWACMPTVTLGFMLATQQSLQGRYPTPRVFIEPLRGERSRTRAMWQLGAIYAVTMLVVASVYSWIDGGRYAALQTAVASGKATPESVGVLLDDSRLQMSLLWFASAATQSSLPLWHAPALVHWGGQTALKALFFSTVACWRNKGAFVVYALTGVAAVMAFALVSSIVFALLGLPGVAAVAMAPAVLLFVAVFYASLYFTFADCFEMAPLAPPAEKETSP